ncbi:DNA-binding response OmpR family regulator [Arthrobacter globiformis]|uniref:response regulator transcription factor n=1 Tax=Arthrobacter globiformis TaxID=1665 RepID=UPI002787AA9C|nr:response regulator [Arthrobacter globiformis]MDQ1060801.1 DNA-binding response OmpR family regulator [Arthrobacter globiformis]
MLGTRTAVVIEDDADVRGLIQAILEASDIDVRTAARGTAGINAVRTNIPDIVILDFGLPDINGLEVINRIRAFSDVYILMLTGHEDVAEQVTSAGANTVMTKPFRPRALKERIHEALQLQLQKP